MLVKFSFGQAQVVITSPVTHALHTVLALGRGGAEGMSGVSPVIEVTANSSLSAQPPQCTTHRQLSQHLHVMYV